MNNSDIEYEKTWKLLQELIEAGKETDQRMRVTDQKLHEMIQAGKETDQRMKVTDQRMKETDQRMKETDQRMRVTDQKLHEMIEAGKETDKKIDKLQTLIGVIGNSNGFVAEDLFFNSFSKKMAIGNTKFECIDRNVERKYKGLKDEFDIVLTNSEVIVIVEVKYNFHPNDVKEVLLKIKNYKTLFPAYKNYKFIGAIAGLTMQNRTIDEAKKYGFFVFTQEGNDLKLLNDKVMEYTD